MNEEKQQNLLRPNQVSDMLHEKKSLEKKLELSKIASVGIDTGAVSGQLGRLNRTLDRQTPKPFKESEVDAVIKGQSERLTDILRGMPSHEEMRKNPTGAVGKHMAWEKAKKEKIHTWKNNELRLHSGDSDPDIANLERFRPTRSTLNMHDAQIPGVDYSMPNGEIPIKNLMSEEDRAAEAVRKFNLTMRAVKDNDTELAAFLGINISDYKDAPEALKKPENRQRGKH